METVEAETSAKRRTLGIEPLLDAGWAARVRDKIPVRYARPLYMGSAVITKPRYDRNVEFAKEQFVYLSMLILEAGNLGEQYELFMQYPMKGYALGDAFQADALRVEPGFRFDESLSQSRVFFFGTRIQRNGKQFVEGFECVRGQWQMHSFDLATEEFRPDDVVCLIKLELP